MSTTNKGIGYNFDEHLELKDVHNIETADGFNFQISELQKNPVDVRVNNNTNIILTQKNTSSKVLIDKTKEIRNRISIPNKLTTYLAPVENTKIEHPVEFVVIDESIPIEEIGCVGIDANVDTVDSGIDGLANGHFFELEFLETYGNFVKISHYDVRKTLYLTYNHFNDRIYFDYDRAPSMSSRLFSNRCFSFVQYADPRQDPQIFEYRLDDKYGYISLSKYILVDGAARVLTLSNESGRLSAISSSVQTLDDLDLLPSFKIDLPTDITSNGLRSSIVSYDRMELYINPNTILPDTKQNILLYDEYKSGKDNTTNMIFLKNQFPNTFEHTTNNIVPGSNRVDYRDYTSIVAGGNQIRGTNKVGVVFNEHTAEIKLKADRLTYFHLPIEIYPYVKLYIGDCGLIESGAIFGDAPINSDKVFKKLANYKQSTINGEPTDDHIGTWACSWLYSPTGKVEDAMWVDRYYDPVTYSFTSALQSSVTTIYDSIIDIKDTYSVDENIKSIFDVKSTVMLEPSTYYAYHHIGVDDLEKYTANKYGDNIIVEDLLPRELNSNTTYSLGDVDAKTGITISFTVEKDPVASWSEPIAYHIIGNYSNTGISVFNNLKYTPVIYAIAKDNDSIKIFNEDFALLNTVSNEVTDPDSSERDTIDTKIKFITVLEPLGNIYCLAQAPALSGQLYIYEYNTSGGVVEFTKLKNEFGKGYEGTVHSVCAYDNIMCIYIDDVPISVDLITETVRREIDTTRVRIDLESRSLRVIDSLYLTGNTIQQIKPLSDKLWFQGDEDYNVKIKSFAQAPTGEVFIIYSGKYIGARNDYVVCLNPIGDRIFNTISITEYMESIDILTDPETSTYNCIVHYDGNLDQDHQLHIFSEINDTLLLIKLSSTGDIISSSQLNNGDDGGIDINSISNFSYLQKNKPNTITIKHKLNNLINRDDIKTLSIDIDVLENFYSDRHHIIYDFDPQSGTATVYIDGEIIGKPIVMDDITYESGDFKPPGKFTFSLFHTDDFRIGEIPYQNNGTLSTFIRKAERPVNTNFRISNLKIFNRSLNRYAARQIAAQSSQIEDIIWTVPYTKRHFIDNIDRIQKHEIPGIKSNNMNIDLHTNENIDNNLITDITTEINDKIREFIPSNVNLTSIDWI